MPALKDLKPETKAIVEEMTELFGRIEEILLQTWQETGFGHLEVDSERIKNDKIRVTIRGSTHYRYVISDEEVEQWLDK